jgi:hypothetical protein
MKHGSTSSSATSLRAGIANKQRQTRALSVVQQTNTISHRGPSRQLSAEQSGQRPAKELAKRPRTEATSADKVNKRKRMEEDEEAKMKRDKNKASQQNKRLRDNEFVSLSKEIRTDYKFIAPTVSTGDRPEWRAQVGFMVDLHRSTEGSFGTTNRVNWKHIKSGKSLPPKEVLRGMNPTSEVPKADVRVVRRGDGMGEELVEALSTDFNVILVPAHKDHCVLLTISDVLRDLDDRQTGQAFMPARTMSRATKSTTHDIDGAEIKRIFDPGEKSLPDDRGVNVLDMKNSSNQRFTPIEIDEVDIIAKILRKGMVKPKSIMRADDTNIQPATHNGAAMQSPLAEKRNPDDMRKWTPADVPPNEEFTILTKAPGVSYYHADSAGQVTCIVGVQGKKIWVIPKGDWEDTRKEFMVLGTQNTNWFGGVTAYEIRAGTVMLVYNRSRDTLPKANRPSPSFQAPGTPHAVLTPTDDSMISGSFIYTAEHFHRSIKCMLLYFEGTLYDNDHTKAADYRRLTWVVLYLDDPDFFTKRQRHRVWLAVQELLSFLGWQAPPKRSPAKNKIVFDGHGSPGMTEFSRPTDDHIAALEVRWENFGYGQPFKEARDNFLDTCAAWYTGYSKRVNTEQDDTDEGVSDEEKSEDE